MKPTDVLKELKSIGALGEPATRLTLDVVELAEPTPVPPAMQAMRQPTLTDLLGPARALVVAAESMTTAANALLSAIERLESGPRDQDLEDRTDDDENPEDPPVEKAAVLLPPPPDVLNSLPPTVDRIAAIEAMRKKVRGDDLSPKELAAAHGEYVVEDDVPSYIPLTRLDLTPSTPNEAQ